MRSMLRFLVFVAVVAAAVGVLYFWKSAQPVSGDRGNEAAGNLPLLTALDREFTALVADVLPSVVSIEAIPPDAVDPRAKLLRLMLGKNAPQESPSSGSGVIVSENGHVVTNLHVVVGAVFRFNRASPEEGPQTSSPLPSPGPDGAPD